MNVLIFNSFRQINVGNSIGPAPLAPVCFGSGSGPAAGTAIQMITLQAIGNGGQANP